MFTNQAKSAKGKEKLRAKTETSGKENSFVLHFVMCLGRNTVVPAKFEPF